MNLRDHLTIVSLFFMSYNFERTNLFSVELTILINYFLLCTWAKPL